MNANKCIVFIFAYLQILRVEHNALVALNIRDNIQIWLSQNAKTPSDSDNESKTSAFQFGHIYMGSRQTPVTLKYLKTSFMEDPAFEAFDVHLNAFINGDLQAEREASMKQRVQLLPHHHVSLVYIYIYLIILMKLCYFASISPIQITECRFMKTDFSSMVTWQILTDYLRCSPLFHGQPRNDGIIYKQANGHIAFGQIQFMFTVSLSDQWTEPIVLILPMKISNGPRSRKDVELGLYRLRACAREEVCFISAYSIVRGALLARDSSSQTDFLVIDLVDTDMFIRVGRAFSSVV